MKGTKLGFRNLPERPVSHTLSVVEFDDHGVLANPAQLDDTINLLKDKIGKGDLSIAVYVHGWKHNASKEDNDVGNFQKLLGLLDLAEQDSPQHKREVVGVYVAWPGALFKVPGDNPVTNALNEGLNTVLTFWSRKEAANRVAEGTIRELFGKIRDIQERRNQQCEHEHDLNPARPVCHTRLVTIGHSFGGTVNLLAEDREERDAVSPTRQPRRR